MKYTILGFQQQAMIDLGLNHTDVMILRWFLDFRPSMKFIEQKEQGSIIKYFWVFYQKLLDDIPTLDIKNKRGIANRFDKLVKLKVLNKIIIKSGGIYTYFSDGINLKILTKNPEDLNTPMHSGEHNLCTLESTPMHSGEHTYALWSTNKDSSIKDSSIKDSSIINNTEFKNSKKDDALNKNIEDFFNHMKSSFSKSNIKLTNDRIKAIKKLFKKEHAYDDSKKYYSLDELKKAYTLFLKNKWNIDNNQHFNLAYFYREIDKLMLTKADISTDLIAENIDIKNVSQRELIKNCDFYIDNFGIPEELRVGFTAKEVRKKLKELKELELKNKESNNE